MYQATFSFNKERAHDEALADSSQGTVIVEAEIVGDGPPAYVSVVRSVHPAPDKAVKAIRFNPGKNQGKSVKTKVMIPVKFRLN